LSKHERGLPRFLCFTLEQPNSGNPDVRDIREGLLRPVEQASRRLHWEGVMFHDARRRPCKTLAATLITVFGDAFHRGRCRSLQSLSHSHRSIASQAPE
jgi:hypothetical protein